MWTLLVLVHAQHNPNPNPTIKYKIILILYFLILMIHYGSIMEYLKLWLLVSFWRRSCLFPPNNSANIGKSFLFKITNHNRPKWQIIILILGLNTLVYLWLQTVTFSNTVQCGVNNTHAPVLPLSSHAEELVLGEPGLYLQHFFSFTLRSVFFASAEFAEPLSIWLHDMLELAPLSLPPRLRFGDPSCSETHESHTFTTSREWNCTQSWGFTDRYGSSLAKHVRMQPELQRRDVEEESRCHIICVWLRALRSQSRTVRRRSPLQPGWLSLCDTESAMNSRKIYL